MKNKLDQLWENHKNQINKALLKIYGDRFTPEMAEFLLNDDIEVKEENGKLIFKNNK